MAQETMDERSGSDRALSRDGVIDLRVVAEILRGRPGIVMVTVIAFLLLAIVYLHVAQKKYAVKMEIAASSSTTKENGGDLSALSSLAGLDLGGGGGGNAKFRMFLGELRSPVAAEVVVADQDILKEIFPQEWSQTEGRWREPAGVLHAVGKFLGFVVSPWSPPGENRVYDYLDRQLKITTDSKSGVVTLEIDSVKPAVAARILILLNDSIDELMRKRDLAHAREYISYLTNRLSVVTVDDYRKPLISNLAEQERTRMQASAPLPYVSDILGKPMVLMKPVSPSPILTLGGGIFLGGIVGLGLASVAYYRRWNFRIWPTSGSRLMGFGAGKSAS